MSQITVTSHDGNAHVTFNVTSSHAAETAKMSIRDIFDLAVEAVNGVVECGDTVAEAIAETNRVIDEWSLPLTVVDIVIDDTEPESDTGDYVHTFIDMDIERLQDIVFGPQSDTEIRYPPDDYVSPMEPDYGDYLTCPLMSCDADEPDSDEPVYVVTDCGIDFERIAHLPRKAVWIGCAHSTQGEPKQWSEKRLMAYVDVENGVAYILIDTFAAEFI